MSTESSTRVWGKLPPHIYTYFFRQVLAGEHSSKQALVEHFFELLYEECLRRKVKPVWTEGSAAIVYAIASNLNFDDARDRQSHPPTTQHKKEPAPDPHD